MKVSIAVATACLVALMHGAAQARQADEHEQEHEQGPADQHGSAEASAGLASPADCRRIDLAVERTYLATQKAWGWDLDALHAQSALIPRYLGTAEYFAKEDAKALDNFLSKPGVFVDPATRQQVDCRPLQNNARVVRDSYTDYMGQLRSAKATCDTPVEVLDGRCGRAAGQAFAAGDRLRGGSVSEFERVARESPGACKRMITLSSDLSTPPCRRMTDFGPLCGSLQEGEARLALAGAAGELRKLEGEQAKLAAPAALATINSAIDAFDRFSRSRSDDKLLLTASVQASNAHEVVRTGLARNLCSPSGAHGTASSSGAPAGHTTDAHTAETHDAHQTNWHKHLRVHRH